MPVTKSTQSAISLYKRLITRFVYGLQQNGERALFINDEA